MSGEALTIRDALAIREAGKADAAAVQAVLAEAFARPAEAHLALALWQHPVRTIGLVATVRGEVIGHVLLSELAAPLPSAALAPVGVVPRFQDLGIGTALVRAALEAGREAGLGAVFVLGEPGYYERFGFRSALADPFEVPWQGASFMAVELREGALAGRSGRLGYPPPFGV